MPSVDDIYESERNALARLLIEKQVYIRRRDDGQIGFMPAEYGGIEDALPLDLLVTELGWPQDWRERAQNEEQ